jgi:uncharacterized protein (TIGR03790 family)
VGNNGNYEIRHEPEHLAKVRNMSKPTIRSLLCGAFLVAFGCLPRAAWAQDGANVLLVLHEATDVSGRVAAQYARVRNIPAENIVRLRTDASDDITRAQYEGEIERPIGEWLSRHAAQDRILYIVLTKGIPLRIRGTAGRRGTTASVDSELTLLYRRLVGGRETTVGPIPNPYFWRMRPLSELKPFSHADYDLYLVSRLDGFTEADAIALIDRGLSPVRSGDFLLDQRGSLDRVADPWLQATADTLTVVGYKERVVLESSRTTLTDRQNVLGYASWGSNDPGIRRRLLGLGFVPGALATTFVSSDARTMQEPPENWQPGADGDPKASFAGSTQSLTGDLIREGVTGVAGHVAEPFLDGAIRPDILFPAYVAGFNLIESFYLAMPSLSWQTVVFGDPLCAPFRSDQLLTRDLAAPDLDPETELPRYLSARRLASLLSANVPSEAAKLMLRAEARRSRDDRAGMREALEQAIAIDPRLTAAQTMLAGLYEELGEYDRAIERYRIVLAVNPSDPVALNNLAYALAVRRGVPAEALPFAQRAYIAAKRNALIADTLGWVYYLLGHHVDAEKYISEAAKLSPDHAEIQLHLAHVYLALGRTEPALAALNRSLQLDVKFSGRDDVKKLQAQLKN